jgi:crotonobetainyl-CoA:carnitine CoA-transferase CaiB-like acyl-CoA transferase
MTPPVDGLLSGLRVLEFGHIAAGPFAGSLFADMGADVVKVERPDSGDGMRAWPPHSVNEEGVAFSENFASLNRNKRSIVVDMKDTEEVERLRQLCERADIIIENFRPGTLARLGLGYEDLAEQNPGLVYCSLSGYGQTGPFAERGAFDVTVQAMSGVMSVTGEEGGAPAKCGVPIGDFCAGLYGSFSILAVIVARQRTGRGAHIDCSMLGSLLGISALQTSEYFGTGRSQGALGSAHPRNAPYQAFRGSDAHFAIAAGNDKLWAQVCEATGLPELVTDPRFETQLSRAQNQAELAAILQQVFEGRTAEYWIEEMDRRGVPSAPINTFPDVLSDPHVAHMGLVQALRLPNGVETKTVTFPVKVTGRDFGIFSAPPELGAHNEAVFEEWLQE